MSDKKPLVNSVTQIGLNNIKQTTNIGDADNLVVGAGIKNVSGNLTLTSASGNISVAGGKIINGAAPTAGSSDLATAAYSEAVAQVMAADKKFYVSPNGSDTYNGKSEGRPFATISAALTALGTGTSGGIVLLPGTHNAPTTGIKLDRHQWIHGLGTKATIINGATATASPNSSYVVKLSGSRGGLSNLSVEGGPAGATLVLLGLGASSAPGSNQNSRITNVFAELIPVGGIGFGIGSYLGPYVSDGYNVPDGASDVSEALLVGCRAAGGSGYDASGFKFGNGALANVLDNVIIGGTATSCLYGVHYYGGSGSVIGCSFVQNQGGADIYIYSTGSGHCSISKCRSEGALQFLNLAWATQSAGPTLHVHDCSAHAMINTNGKGINLSGAPIRLSNIRISGYTVPQYIYVNYSASNETASNRLSLVVTDQIYSDHPHPFGTPWGHQGVRMLTRNTFFLGGAPSSIPHPNRPPEAWVRRYSVTSATAATEVSFNPSWFDEISWRLSDNWTVTPTLSRGTAIGQRLTVHVEQDGYGGRTWTWPTNIAWDSGIIPSNFLTSRGRQTVRFEWTGSYWAQDGSVINILPPAKVSDPLTENFQNPDIVANTFYYWLDKPSGGGASWEHVPGGGALGSDGTKCKCYCTGTFGDTGTVGSSMTGIFVAGAVRETGMDTTPTGISVTITSQWGGGDGIIAHYLDDRTFVMVHVFSSTLIFIRGYVNGILDPSFTQNFNIDTALVAGSTHTLLVKLTATGYQISLDGGASTLSGGQTSVTRTPVANSQVQVADLTKHGFILGATTSTCSSISIS